jgi:serine/threonine protein kinase
MSDAPTDVFEEGGPPELPPDLELIESLRPGGLCTIELVRTAHGQLRVLKTLKPEHRHRPDLADIVAREGAILRRLQHPSVVQSFGLVLRDGEPSLVLEYVVGWSLAAVLRDHYRRRRMLPRPLVYNVLLQLLEVLSYLHSVRDEGGNPLLTCHQDISPGNVVVQPDGTIKLLDFGLSVHAGDVQAATPGFIRGTPGYLSPEQARGRSGDAKSDVFSAAVVAVALLGDGRSPFARPRRDEVLMATAFNRRAPIGALLAELPPPVAEALEGALTQDPAVRPSAGSLALALLGAIEASGERVANRADVVEYLAVTLPPSRPPAPAPPAPADPEEALPELSPSDLVSVSLVVGARGPERAGPAQAPDLQAPGT